MYILLNTFDPSYINVVIHPQIGETFYFDDKKSAEEYGKENLQEYIVVEIGGKYFTNGFSETH